jgi:predicted outer membrane repeat protein
MLRSGLVHARVVGVLSAACLLLVPAYQANAAPALKVCATGCPYATIDAALAAASTGDKIVILDGTYAGGFTITKSVSLHGAGADQTRITLNHVFEAGSVVTVAAGVDVTIRGVTITGGSAFVGGGVHNSGTLTLKDSVVRDNRAEASVSGAAGGIYNGAAGDLKLRNSLVADNVAADGFGGGIVNEGTMVLVESGVTGNSGLVSGGIGNSGSATLRHSEVMGNVVAETGGGISNGGTMVLKETTVADNRAFGTGGGIANSGKLKLADSLVTRNTAIYDGGGICSTGDTLKLNDSTVTGNTPNDFGGCAY